MAPNILTLLWLLGITAALSAPAYDIFDYIDPFIGTINGGHVFPGASRPFSIAKAVADVSNPDEKQGGFASDNSPITGFSHMHDSGTGGAPSLGNFPIFAHAGCAGNDLNRCAWRKADRATLRTNGTARASPGYFAITLENGVSTAVTVAERTALYKFSFPAGGDSERVILLDASDLPDSRVSAKLHVDPDSGRITASGTFHPSFGIGTYKTYACVDFSSAVARTGVWVNTRAETGVQTVAVEEDGVNLSPPLPAGVFVTLAANTDSVLVRVGLSFVSVAQACGNAEREIPDFDFDRTLAAARAAWREKLEVVSITPGTASAELQTVFWSGLYRSLLSPQDYTGENPLWESDEPYYDSYYCIWDSFRSIHPLLNVVAPKDNVKMVRSLLDIYRHEGKLPDCRMSLCKGLTQGGSNADVVLVDTFLKGRSADVDWELALEAMISDAEDEPANWSVEGRGGLKSWKELGYIPTDDFDPYGVGAITRSISRTVEYAYNDFNVHTLSSALHPDKPTPYLSRSTNWRNMFSPTTRSLNYTGFLQPRYTNGTFGAQDPRFCSPALNFTSCYLNPSGSETYEGSSWLYTFYVPHDHASLISLLGGRAAFISRLQTLHTTPGLHYLGDEQAFLTTYQYHYAGAPHLSADTARSYIPAQFNASAHGIPGNDDSGAMGSFVALAMIGLWPVPGQDVYLITPPFFEQVAVRNGVSGRTARVVSRGAGRYVVSARLDGRVWTRNWVTHGFWVEGGTLELMLGDTPGKWGTGEADVPPSYSPAGMAHMG
ncbi:glycoside hydrolase family 92 protein [Geopyxis carbonaria]|nr:glycoside hydrolase family 92 protein [Geopyxis carbonaria]